MTGVVRTCEVENKSGGGDTYVIRSIGCFAFFNKTADQNVLQCVCMYVCMYEIRDRQDPVKGSGWVLFPSTMAEQPEQ